MAHSLDGAVVQVQVRHLESGSAGNAVRIPNHSEAMVLGRDEYLPGAEIAHRVISAAMAVRHLRRLSPEGQSHQLMTEADSERRQAAGGELAYASNRVLHGGGIAWPVGKEEPVRL